MNIEALNDLVVVKRSGQRVSFNGTKIAVAIKAAFDTIYETYDESQVNFVYNKVIEDIIKEYTNRKTINVEDIQDIIENNLKKHKFDEVYNAFYTYRLKRKASRETFQVRKEHKFVKVIEQISNYFQDDKPLKPIEQLTTYGKAISNEFARSYLIDNKYVRLFDDGSIYIHNIDMQGNATIDSYNIDLTTISDDNLNSYTNKLIDILRGIKTDVYGYINVPNIDILYKKVLIKHFIELLKENLHDYLSLEGFDEFINAKKIDDLVERINTLNINESYFESIATSTRFRDIIKFTLHNTLNKIELELHNNLYHLINSLNNIKIYLKNNEYSFSISSYEEYENNMIRDSFIKILKDNNKYDNISIIFKIKANQNVTELLTIIDKNIYFLNDIKKDLEFFASGHSAYENYWGSATSLGKVINASTSINLVRIGITSQNEKEYFNNLGEMMDIVSNELLQSFELIGNKNKDHFNYLYNNEIFSNIDLEEGQKIRKLIKNGTLQIGFAGLYESILALNKKFDINLAKRILEFMSEKCKTYTNNNKLNFALTPVVCPRALKHFIKIDRSVYGNLLNITDKKKYTNNHEIVNYDSIDYDYLNLIGGYVTGGLLTNIRIDKSLSLKKQNEIIQNLLSNNIPFFKIITTKEDDV